MVKICFKDFENPGQWIWTILLERSKILGGVYVSGRLLEGISMTIAKRTATGMTALLLTILTTLGCDLNKQVEPKRENPGPERTQEIGEHKSPAESVVQPSPISTPAPTIGGATDFVIETTAKLQIESAIEQYRALNGNYPKSHEEFMEEVIRKGDIHLNAPPAGKKYEYDVENHELKVVNG